MFLTVARPRRIEEDVELDGFSFVEVDKARDRRKISKVRTAKPRHCYRTSDESIESAVHEAIEMKITDLMCRQG